VVRAGHSFEGVTEIAGVDNVARSNMEWWKTREWTNRHEEAGVSDHEQ